MHKGTAKFANVQNLQYFCIIMKILIAPLNWGLGHATRCIPLIKKYVEQKDEVVIGGNGESLLLLKRTFPTLRILNFADLKVTYSPSESQVLAMAKAAPKIIISSIKDHIMLQNLLKNEHFDIVLSDNRFGMYVSKSWRKSHAREDTKTYYIAHQLNIKLPRFWRWAEGIATAIHRRIYTRYDKILVPDFADETNRLSGDLSKGGETMGAEYTGPLSRFNLCNFSTLEECKYDTVAVLSGPEPQRSKLEKTLIRQYENADETVLIIRGRIAEPPITLHHGNITLVPHIKDDKLAAYLQGCRHIVARSGYSTIMDLYALGVLDKAELIPTEGQSEQEYLAEHIKDYIKRLAPSPASAT